MLLPSEPLSPRALAHTLWRAEDMPDLRLFERLCRIPQLVIARLEQPTTSQSRAERRGAQRLWNNERVEAKVLSGRADAYALERLRDVTRVVFAHDTTECDERDAGDPSDAGPLRSSHARGYLLHYCVAVVPESKHVLGVLCTQAWTRSWNLRKQGHKKRAAHDKESIKWRRGIRGVVRALRGAGLELACVHAMDREGDVFENFTFARREKHQVVVRAAQDRNVLEGGGKLWGHLHTQRVVFTRELRVDNHPCRKARKEAKKQSKEALERFEKAVAAHGTHRRAQLDVRFAHVTLKAPKTRRGHVGVNAVYVSEVGVPAELEPLEWMLLTTCDVTSPEDALSVITDYESRWPIEPMNHVLKTGCHLEQETVDGIESFRRLVAIMVPIALHLVRWMFAARQTPKELASDHVQPPFLACLKEACRFHSIALPRRPWTIKDVVYKLAQLGGFELRPDRVPGWLVLWRGYREVSRLAEAFQYARSTPKQAPD